MLQARAYKPRCFANRAVKHFEASVPMTSDVVAPAAESAAANGHGEAHSTARFTALLIGSIGVVYGDIGTSPLYAFREAVVAASGSAGAVTPQAVLGVLSLIAWALIIVVTLKYVVILLRADNNGEGGTLALMALAQRAGGRGAGTVVRLASISGARLYGCAVITPALRGVSRRHRCRGAICRPRAFWQTADPDRLAFHRIAVAGAELSGAGRSGHCRPESG